MKLTDCIHESDGLSLELKKILAKANQFSFAKLAKQTRLSLRTEIPKLTVRHLASMERALQMRRLDFAEDNSICLDHFINQRKLFNLWEAGIYTYQQLDNLPFIEFEILIGGPQSSFFRNKSAAKHWMEKHGLATKQRFELPHLTSETAKLLYKGNLKNLREVAKKTDFQLARIIQSNFGKVRASPLTRARLSEIKYALWKEGINRPFKPL